MNHDTVHPPVYPPCVGILICEQMPGADIPTSISIMHHRDREHSKVNIIPCDDILLARPLLYQNGLNRLLAPSIKCIYDLPDRCIWFQIHRYRHSPETGSRGPRHTMPWIISNLLKERGWRPGLAGSSNNRPCFQVPIYLPFYPDCFTLFHQRIKKFTIISKCHLSILLSVLSKS